MRQETCCFGPPRRSDPAPAWPTAVPKPPAAKNGLSAVEHHRPHGWQVFVTRLCEIDCVSRVLYDQSAFGGAAVKMIDGSRGAVAVRYGPTDNWLPLRVETSARGDAQTKLVVDYIANTVL